LLVSVGRLNSAMGGFAVRAEVRLDP